MAEIYLCDVQFVTKQHKVKTPIYGQTEKLVLTLDDDGQPLFKQYEMQKKHNDSITPMSKNRILDLKVLKKVTYLGSTVFNLENDKRHIYQYNGTFTGKKS